MFRPPYIPIAMGPLAGRDVGQSYSAKRKSAIHSWHHENGAIFVDAGQWLRPQYYLRDDEADTTQNMDIAITREVQGTRGSVGVVDVSTLGKIDIQGADSGEFLNRIYTNGWTKLAIGKARYGLMLREDGIVFDDGTTSRLSEHHYFMTTTTSNAASVLSHMEYCLKVHWPDLDVKISSVTEQWAAMAIAGPKSRDVLQRSIDGADLSDETLPFMGVTQVAIDGIPALIFRISFSGELAYEVNVPADYGEYVWRRIMEKGRTDNIIPYGTEAMAIMRIEKGHVAGGELDGRTTPDDLGLNKLISSKKEFIGRRLLEREGFRDLKRPKLVGLIPIDGKSRIRTGSILVENPNASFPMPKLGHVSSGAYLSPTLRHPISLGLITGGSNRIGETVWATSPLHGEVNEVKIVDPVFYDKQGERLNG
jgi:sarcosine oxidase subunit alpha